MSAQQVTPGGYDWPPEAYERILAAIREPLPKPEPLPDFINVWRDAGDLIAWCNTCGLVSEGDDLAQVEEHAWVHVDEWHEGQA